MKYSIRSRKLTHHHIQSWVIERSNYRDDSRWIESDRQKNITELSQVNQEVTFPIAQNDWFREVGLDFDRTAKPPTSMTI
jgi:hypothetical protein